MEEACRLCGAPAPLYLQNVRRYFACPACGYVFAGRAWLLDDAAARARYDLHRNGPADAGYVAFLRRLADPLIARLPPGAEGLDFGCGPGPALAGLLGASGFPTAEYDPLYKPDAALLGRAWDFVACTETVEHFARPAEDWATLFRLLRPGGVLAVMTSLTDGVDFPAWHYQRDPTHVGFYSLATLGWLARRHGARLEALPPSVAFFTRP